MCGHCNKDTVLPVGHLQIVGIAQGLEEASRLGFGEESEVHELLLLKHSKVYFFVDLKAKSIFMHLIDITTKKHYFMFVDIFG